MSLYTDKNVIFISLYSVLSVCHLNLVFHRDILYMT